MVRTNSSSPILKRIFVIAVIVVLGLGFAFVLLEKTKVTDFYKKPISPTNTASDVRPVNTVVYTPATTTETDEGERIKAAAQASLSATPTPTGDKIDVSLSAAGQDSKGGPVVIRAILGTTGGQCKLTLAGANKTQDLTANVINLGTYYGCEGFDVPITDFPAGIYKATLTVTNGTATGSASQQLEVAK